MANSILAELAYHPDEGGLRFRGVRYLLIRPETLASLLRALAGEVGPERAGDLLYAGGFTGGQLSGRRYKADFGLNDREAVEFMCRMGGEIGWGRFSLVALDPDAERLVVEVDHSPFAAAYGAGAPAGVCHLVRGVLGGLADGLFGNPVRAREVQCMAQGDPKCRFEVEPAAVASPER